MGTRRLVMTWSLLMGLMAFAGLLAGVSGATRPGAPALAALAVVTAAKARLILARYLRLDSAPAFLAAFTFAAAIVMAIVTLTFLIDFRRPDPSRNRRPGDIPAVAVKMESVIPRRPATG